jgi:DNA-binding transcriptional regulator GbsR (MarR family)
MPATNSERQGLTDYKEFLTVLREELDRAMKPVSDDLKQMSTDVKAMQANTYNREMMDQKLEAITTQLKTHDDDLKVIHSMIGNSWRELFERLGAVAGIGYALVYIIPHIFH